MSILHHKIKLFFFSFYLQKVKLEAKFMLSNSGVLRFFLSTNFPISGMWLQVSLQQLYIFILTCYSYSIKEILKAVCVKGISVTIRISIQGSPSFTSASLFCSVTFSSCLAAPARPPRLSLPSILIISLSLYLLPLHPAYLMLTWLIIVPLMGLGVQRLTANLDIKGFLWSLFNSEVKARIAKSYVKC